MRIAIDLRYAQDRFPGIGRYVLGLASALPRLAAPHSWLLIHDPRTRTTRLDLARLAQQPGVQMHAVRAAPFSLAEQIALPALARRLSVDVWHAPYYVMPYRLGKPTVLTFYDAIAHRYPEVLAGTWKRPIFELLTRLAVRAASRVAAISEVSRQDLVRFYRATGDRVAVTPLGVDSSFSPQPEPEVAEVCNRVGLPRPYVLYLASNKPHKNLVRLLQSWRIVTADQELEKCHLVIAGHWDPRFPEALQASKELGLTGSVQFVGSVAEEDLPAVYTGARAFVFPSLYEGFGLPVLEAMACGAPVVCSNTSSLPEVAGDAAVTADPMNVEALAEAMRTVLRSADLRADLRKRGLARAATFTWERTARLTLNLYEQAANEPRPGMAAGGSL